jgi:hypothetical protein
MFSHSRLWWFVLIAVAFLLLATTLGRSETSNPSGANAPAAQPAIAPADPESAPPPKVAPPTPAPMPTQVPRAPEKSPTVTPAAPLLEPSALALAVATLALHLVATVFALRIGLKVFYENTLFGGFCMIVIIDALVLAALLICAPLTDGFTQLWGPQVVVTALVMVLTVHHYGFSKDRFTVMPAVLVTKAVGFFAEVVLRMLFLEALTRLATEKGL